MVPLTELYCIIDDFCKAFDQSENARLLPSSNRQRKRYCSMSVSEIMTIMVVFHLSHYRTFKDFYRDCVQQHHSKDFPKLVSYTRFVELMKFAAMPLYVFATILKGQKTEKYYIDSTKIQVCENLRIRSNKVFKYTAKRGKTSTGWFFGFKLHLVINHQGEIMSFKLTPGNVDDRAVVTKITEGLKGWIFGDKGYIKKELKEELEEKGLSLITKQKKNTKQIFLEPVKKAWLSKRGVIESSIDQLKSLLHIQHTRHRSHANFFVNIMAGLVAYIMKPKKPTVSFGNFITGMKTLLMSN